MPEINLEQTVLKNLITNEEFTRKVVPFISPDYFEGVYSTLFKEFTKFVAKYNKLPTQEHSRLRSMRVTVCQMNSIVNAIEILPNLFVKEETNLDWLIDRTESWCQDRAVFNAVMESINIIEGKHKTLAKGSIPDVLTTLGVTFDTNIGHDYLENVDARYDFYHEKEERLPFDLEYFNSITKGGHLIRPSTSHLLVRVLVKVCSCVHCAGRLVSREECPLHHYGNEERIAERIDANLLNVPIDQLENLSKDMFRDRVGEIARKTQGKLIVKEYPTGQQTLDTFVHC